MPKFARNLTKREIAAIKMDGLHMVGHIPGLSLNVRGAARSWIYRYADHTGRHSIGLGSCIDTDFETAYDRAMELRREARAGHDPIARLRADRTALIVEHRNRRTFAEAAQEYFAAKSAKWSKSHAAQWLNTLRDYCGPIADMDCADINLAAVLRVLEPVWNEKPETGSRVRGRIEVVLDAATVKQYRTGPNPAAWKGNLDKCLSAPSKAKSKEHHAALNFADAAGFVSELRELNTPAANCLEFLILTATRSNEARGISWAEVAGDVWSIPANRMKAGEAHRVPLSPRAVAILSAAEGKAAPFADVGRDAMSSTLARLRPGVTVHGFRSMFRDWAGETGAAPREVCEAALAHTIGNSTEAAYRRGDALTRRAALMGQWAAYVGDGSAKVLDFAARAAG
jgi:integrase